MANPSVTNVSGSNPGQNGATLPDTIQLPTGNFWKMGTFNVSLTHGSAVDRSIHR